MRLFRELHGQGSGKGSSLLLTLILHGKSILHTCKTVKDRISTCMLSLRVPITDARNMNSS